MRLPPIGFWSYARQDDDSSGGRLSLLRSLLQNELQQQYGRDPIKIFQDVSAIPPGAEWEAKITAALSDATFFIPIITPAFIQSEWCCKEVEIFLKREKLLREHYAPLRDQSRIFPISYISIDDIEDAYDPEVIRELMRLQWVNFIPYRNRDFQREDVAVVLEKLSGQIKKLLYIRVQPLPTTEELAAEAARQARDAELAEAARREAAARDRAAREAEAEERRQAEEKAKRERAAEIERQRQIVLVRKQAREAAAAERVRLSAERAQRLRDGVMTRQWWGTSRLLLIGGAVSGALLVGGSFWWSRAQQEQAAVSGRFTEKAGEAATSASTSPINTDALRAMVGAWRPRFAPDACKQADDPAIIRLGVAGYDLKSASPTWRLSLSAGGRSVGQSITHYAAGDWVFMDGGLWRLQGEVLQVASSEADKVNPVEFVRCPEPAGV